MDNRDVPRGEVPPAGWMAGRARVAGWRDVPVEQRLGGGRGVAGRWRSRRVATMPRVVTAGVVGAAMFGAAGMAPAAATTAEPVTAGLHVLAWGQNSDGQLGNGSTQESGTPVRALLPKPLPAIVDVSAGEEHSLAVTDQGLLYAWGGNRVGQIGNGSKIDQPHPERVLVGHRVKDVAAAELHSVALTADGKQMFAWGSNVNEVLDDDTYDFEGSLTPVPVLQESPPLSGDVTFTDVEAKSTFNLALTSDGRVYAWGENSWGSLGQGYQAGTSPNPTPTQVKGLPPNDPVVAIAAGSKHALALTEGGRVYAWGDNSNGQLANDTTGRCAMNYSPTPWQVLGPLVDAEATAIGAGTYHSLAVVDGKVYTWGNNDQGQLGRPGPTPQPTPTQVSSPQPQLPANVSFTDVAGGDRYSMALASNGQVYSWGANDDSQLGHDDIGAPAPVPPTGSSPATEVTAISAGYSHTLAIAAPLAPRDGTTAQPGGQPQAG